MDNVLLAVVFQRLTNNLHGRETAEDVISELVALKDFLQAEAEVFGLKGIAKKIHSTLVVEELDDFSIPDMLAYLDLMHYEYDIRLHDRTHDEVAQATLLILIKRLETMRASKFAAEVFFGHFTERMIVFPGIMFQTETPDTMSIQELGPKYFFPMVGELTRSNLLDHFDFVELMTILFNFYNTKGWKLYSGTTKEELADALLTEVLMAQTDPLTYLTLGGPISVFITEIGESNINISEMTTLNVEDVMEAASWESIDTQGAETGVTKPLEVMWEELTISQLTNAFMGHVGRHRSMQEACRNESLTDGTDIMQMEYADMVFYGKRDGMSRVIGYSMEELTNHFEDTGGLYTPRSVQANPDKPVLWVPFQYCAIRRLLNQILPYKMQNSQWAKPLSEVLQRLLNDDMALRVQELKHNTQLEILKGDFIAHNMIKRALLMMRNQGAMFVDFEEEIAYIDTDSMVMWMENDPRNAPQEPTLTGRVRAECRNRIMYIQERISKLGNAQVFFENLRIIKFWHSVSDEGYDEGVKYHIDYTNDVYTIRVFLEVMHDIARLGLFRVLKQCGVWLMTTANVIHHELFGSTIEEVGMSHEQSSYEFDRLSGRND